MSQKETLFSLTLILSSWPPLLWFLSHNDLNYSFICSWFLPLLVKLSLLWQLHCFPPSWLFLSVLRVPKTEAFFLGAQPLVTVALHCPPGWLLPPYGLSCHHCINVSKSTLAQGLNFQLLFGLLVEVCQVYQKRYNNTVHLKTYFIMKIFKHP